MKALKYILLGFGVIILSFFSMGFMHASFTYENEVQVNSTIDHSFEIFTNDSLGPKWLNVKLEDIEGSKMIIDITVSSKKKGQIKLPLLKI